MWTFLEDLPKVEQFELSRCIKLPELLAVQPSEAHNVTDASSQGYGVVTYLRQKDADGNAHCSLVMVKSASRSESSNNRQNGVVSYCFSDEIW